MRFKNDIVIIGQQPWDTEIGSNCKDIAVELSKTNRVLYINSPLDRITLLRGKNDPKIKKRVNVIKGREDGLVRIQENLWNYYPDCMVESINWLSNSFLFEQLNRFNNLKFSGSVKKAIKHLGFHGFILFNDNEIFKGYYLKEFLNPILSIYYSRDYMIGVDYWKRHGIRLEPKLIRKSDLCFSNSEYLADYCKRYNKNSFNVGQGCDVQDFVNIPNIIPESLKGIRRKIVGYVGSLNSERLDISIIADIASSLKDCCVVLVGPEDDQFKRSVLHQFDNVFFAGQKPASELPLYINVFDVCINPQLVNEITIGNYPRKIDEYLAVGKPVVATKTKTMEFFKDFVYLAETSEDYVRLLTLALVEDNDTRRSERRNFALTHSWEESVKKMAVEINKLLEV